MSSSTVEQIKERLGIVDVVGQYIKLEKAGSNFKAKCPFHNEKTPSFMVSPSRNSFYCFGCGEGGDIFSFIQKFEGVDFMGALKLLGEKAGVQIVFEKQEKRDEREELYRVTEEASKYFEKALAGKKNISSYLKERGFNDSTTTTWNLGYADGEWRTLHEHLSTQGFSDNTILQAGLIKKTDDGRHYDLFRDRIMFPLRDSLGRIVAFSGRIFSENTDAPKYVNSPETPLFNKSRILYGYDRAKFSIRKSNFSIVVEGQMDLLASHQAGFTNTVAVSGTALTQDQLTFLRRLSSNIVMAFDADNAGLTSAGKGATLALSMGMDVKVAPLPSGSDPADLVKEDPEKWKKAVRDSKHIIEIYLDVLSEKIKDKRKLRLEVGSVVIPFVAHISNKIDQAHFVSVVAGNLGISEEAVWEEVKKKIVNTEIPQEVSTKPQERVLNNKDLIIQFLIHLTKIKDKEVTKCIKTTELKEWILKNIGEKDYVEAKERYKTMTDQDYFSLENKFLNIIHCTDCKDSIGYIEELKTMLKKEIAKTTCEDALADLREAEKKGDNKKIEKAEAKYKKVSDELQKIESAVFDEK